MNDQQDPVVAEDGGSENESSDHDSAVQQDDAKLDAPEFAADGDKSARTNKKKKRMSRAQRRKQKQQKQDNTERFDKREIIKDNENMIKFYKSQNLFSESEFDQFMECLRTTLPASFRINSIAHGHADTLCQLVIRQFEYYLKNSLLESEELSDATKESSETTAKIDNGKSTDSISQLSPAVPALQSLDWYPNKLAWQMNMTRIDLRKSPILRSLHTFIQAETDNGLVSRQESVSMIPPLVMDIRRGQRILDMCAAPGSKTAQLLEYLTFPRDKKLLNDGIVVANDVDNKRCYMLVHQSKRLNSPNCVIINEDASRLPKIQQTPLDGNNDTTEMRFDRILCDAPCSGDGTVRKNPDVWRKWTIGNANNFHGLQSKILKRGVELLAEDGIIVYSTCSMNPVEDEAVVANILRLGQGKLVLEDCSEKLHNLKYRPGLTNWIVMDTNMEIVKCFDDVKPERTSQLHKSIFPPNEEEIKQFHLDRCIRIFPHYQNTGAFFVAVIRKLVPKLPHELIERPIYLDSEGRVQAPKPKRRRFGFKEDPFIFIAKDDKDLLSIKEFYGLSEGFPDGQLTHRCKTATKRSIYLVSEQVRDFIQANEEIEGRQSYVKIINAGMRLFVRAETDAGFRLCQDGVNEILPSIRAELKVPIVKKDLILLLERKSVPFNELSSTEQFRDKLRVGSCILMYTHADINTLTNKQFTVEMPLVAWRGERSIALYVSNTYKIHLRSLVQGKIVSEDTTIATNKQQTVAPIDKATEREQETKMEGNDTKAKEDCASGKTNC